MPAPAIWYLRMGRYLAAFVWITANSIARPRKAAILCQTWPTRSRRQLATDPTYDLTLKSGFYHIGLTGRAWKLYAFTVPQEHYEFLIMPFCLTNAPATFQRCMDTALATVRDITANMIDDIITWGDTVAEAKAMQPRCGMATEVRFSTHREEMRVVRPTNALLRPVTSSTATVSKPTQRR